MPQSNNVRVNEINNHAEHAAERAQVSHEKQPHLTPQESERRNEEHGHLPHEQADHKSTPNVNK